MSTARWRGLVALLHDVTVHGSHAIEKIQLELAGRTFTVLEVAVPAIAAPTQVVRAIHGASVAGVHATIRGVARVADGVLGFALGSTRP